jgi:phosphohistidine phosphatase
MNLYLMRHGIAVDAGDPSVADDSQRPLTNKGVKRMRRAARGLRRLGIDFDVILTSPILRARQTADIVAATLGVESRIQEISGLAPESSVEQLLFGLTRYYDREHLLLVGHQPLLGQLLAYLIDVNRQIKVEFNLGKGSLCRVEVDDIPVSNSGALHWLLTSKQLRLLAGHASKH